MWDAGWKRRKKTGREDIKGQGFGGSGIVPKAARKGLDEKMILIRHEIYFSHMLCFFFFKM